jgi:hypothetical protein
MRAPPPDTDDASSATARVLGGVAGIADPELVAFGIVHQQTRPAVGEQNEIGTGR